MKKAYVKPVMESEEFVANEYVAACWVVDCVCPNKDHGDQLVYTEPDCGNDDNDTYFSTSNGDTYYIGTINGQTGDTNLDVTSWNNFLASLLISIYGGHKVNIYNGANGVAGSYGYTDHPNAS